MSRWRAILSRVLLAAVTLLVTVGLVEVALRFLVRPPQIYSVLVPGTRRLYEPAGIPGISGPASFEVNEHGIRGQPFGPDGSEYRILLVGGSTTECILLDLGEHWGTIAGEALARTADGRRLWIGNVGRSGLTARDHAVAVKYLLPQYPRIDLVVVLVGVNDLTAALRQGKDYQPPRPITDPGAEREQIRRAFALAPGGFHQPMTNTLLAEGAAWYESTAIYQLIKRAVLGRRARNLVQDTRGANFAVWMSHRRAATTFIDTLPDLTLALADYRESLNAIVRAARAGNAEVLFMTQPSLWKRDIIPAEASRLWLGGTGAFQEEPGHAYYTVPALTAAMDRYNGVTLEVCRQAGLPCLDLATVLPADTVTFYDDVHFTEAGAAAIGWILAAHLRASRSTLFGPPEAHPVDSGGRFLRLNE